MRLQRQNRHNILNQLVLIAALAGLVTLAAAAAWGTAGMAGAAAAALLLLLLSSCPAALLLRLNRARPMTRGDCPDGHPIVAGLCRQAGLTPPPRLYYLPSPIPNAITLGDRGTTVIVLTDALTRLLDRRELTAVLAHEIGHLVNGDLDPPWLAGILTRLATLMARTGLVLFIPSLPLILLEGGARPWHPGLTLATAAAVIALWHLARMRGREFAADRAAIELTGDPAGLIAALNRLHPPSRRRWGRLLRTHPAAQERVRRLGRPRPPPGPAASG